MTLTRVVVEGASDVAAVRRCAATLGVSLGPVERVELVDLGGITNVGRALSAAADEGVRVLGLCDAAETRVVTGALRRAGVRSLDGSPAALAAHGFWVCDRDLEDELVRALGVAACVERLRALRLAGSFETFCQQPAWAGRDPVDQLRRFAGAGSGRKLRMADAFAAALAAHQVPAPVAALLERVDLVSSRD